MIRGIGTVGLKKDRPTANLANAHVAGPIDTSALLPCLRLGAGFCSEKPCPPLKRLVWSPENLLSYIKRRCKCFYAEPQS